MHFRLRKKLYGTVRAGVGSMPWHLDANGWARDIFGLTSVCPDLDSSRCLEYLSSENYCWPIASLGQAREIGAVTSPPGKERRAPSARQRPAQEAPAAACWCSIQVP